jgi:hypothetical protein
MVPAAGRAGVESGAAGAKPVNETARCKRTVSAWALTRFRRSLRAAEGASHALEEAIDGFH